MSVVQCDACGRDMIANDDDTVGYCPDCAAEEVASHGDAYQRRQAESQRDAEARRRVIDGRMGRGDRR